MTSTTKERLVLPSDQDASGRNLGKEELALLGEVIASGVLNSIKGTKVQQFEKEFAALYGSSHCIACSSGSAAIHAAIAAFDLEPYDEIITSPITDMGALTPIIYQGCVPVFADVDPYSYNVTAESIKKRITPKTRAIIATHLFGNPCQMDLIMKLADTHGIPVVEDCAQAFLAKYSGRYVGTIGKIGVFSMQQGKHMTTGEGGMVITDDPALARRIKLYVNKAWGYGDPAPDHYFLALNYRLTELQGAVALAQIKKLQWVVESRQKAARLMDERLRAIPGIRVPQPPVDGTHVYWKYCLDVNEAELGFEVPALAAELKKAGILSVPRYIQKPAFRCQVIREQVTFGKSRYPFSKSAGELFNDEARCRTEYPGAYDALRRVLVLPWNEYYTEEHVNYLADKILLSLEVLKSQKGAVS